MARFFKLPILILVLPLAVPMATAGSQTWYTGNGVVQLEPTGDRIVLRGRGLPDVVEISGMRLHRDPGARYVAGALSTWRLEDLPAGTSGRAAEEAAVALASRPGVDWASPVYLADGGAGGEWVVAGEILVRPAEGVDAATAAEAAGLEVQGVHAPGCWILGRERASSKELLRAAAELVELGLAEWAEPVMLFPVEARYIPNDPRHTEQWHLHNQGQGGGQPDVDVNAREGWDRMPSDARLGHPDIIIAVADSGLDPNHEDLAPAIWNNAGEIPGNGIDDDGNFKIDDLWGWDFLEDGGDDGDPGLADGQDNNPEIGDLCDDHGVSVAGVAAARGDNSLGMTGACAGCRVLAMRIFSDAGFASNAAVSDAFRYAARSGAAIINNSWGPTAPVAPLPASIKDGIDFAVDQGRGGLGTAFFWSAGNNALDGQSVDDDGMSSYSRVMTIGAINDIGQRSLYSETGSSLDLVAPSNDTRSNRDGISTTQSGEVVLGNCQARNYTGIFGGTSSASPLAAGVGGLVLSAVPSLRPEKLQRILEDAADTSIIQLYDPVEHGKGAVRADAALDDVMAGPTFSALAYECIEDEVLISVRDASASGSVEVLVTSDQEPGGETLSCTEVPGRPGLFEGLLATDWSVSPTPSDGILVVGPGDRLVAEYAGLTDEALGTCSAATCFEDPAFAGVQSAEDSADCSGVGPTLSWDPPTHWGSGGPGFYTIYRGTTPDFDPDAAFRPHALTTQTTWTDFLSITPGTNYWYVVRAENDETGCGGPNGGMEDGNTLRLSARAGANDAQAPVTGVAVRRRPTDGVAEIDWDEVSGALSYDVYRGDFGGSPFAFSPACHAPDVAPGSFHEDPELPGAGAGFYYLVTVEGACGLSPFGPADAPRPDPVPCP